MKHPEHVNRVVKDGCVHIFGNTYRPSEVRFQYDGELEGKNLVFGMHYDENTDRLLDFCLFWKYVDVEKETPTMRDIRHQFLVWNEV